MKRQVEGISINSDGELTIINRLMAPSLASPDGVSHRRTGPVTCPLRLASYEVSHQYSDQVRYCHIDCAALYFLETDDEIEAYCKSFFHVFCKKENKND